VVRRTLALTVLLLAFSGAVPAAGAQAVLPDLGMAKLSTVTIDTTTLPGHRLLRYTATMVNIGQGALEVRGTRPDTSSPMTVVQRVYNDDGTFADVSKPIRMQYAGDGHDHWHSLDMEGGALVRLDNGKRVGALAKHGFCFFDNVAFRLTLANAPQAPHYTGQNSCAFNSPAALSVMMGLSIGWGDMYSAQTNFQWIDITALPNGRYRLTATADPKHLVSEASYSNNSASARIRINGTSVTVLSRSPGA
jgi:Lysyl oxidase